MRIVSRKISKHISAWIDASVFELTPLEKYIIKMYYAGKSVRAISIDIGWSEETVKRKYKTAIRKLDNN